MVKVYDEDYSDSRNKEWCIHCGKTLSKSEVNRDHVPSKVMLERPYPTNLPVIPVCKKCNESFSRDEEYFAAFISAVLSGTTDPDKQRHQSGRRILQRNKSLRSRIDRSREAFTHAEGSERSVWKPEIDRLECVVEKNARAHVFFENGEPMLDKACRVLIQPLETASPEFIDLFFQKHKTHFIWPEVGSIWMQRLLEDDDFDTDGFIVVQDPAYRFRLDFENGVEVRSEIYGYLACLVGWD